MFENSSKVNISRCLFTVVSSFFSFISLSTEFSMSSSGTMIFSSICTVCFGIFCSEEIFFSFFKDGLVMFWFGNVFDIIAFVSFFFSVCNDFDRFSFIVFFFLGTNTGLTFWVEVS